MTDIKQRFYIGPDWHGIAGDPARALLHPNAPLHEIDEYDEVSQREYEETVFDYRYEGGDWFR